MRLLQYGLKKCCRLTDTYGQLQTPKKLVNSYSRGFYTVSRTIAPSCCNRTVGGFQCTNALRACWENQHFLLSGKNQILLR